MKITILGLKEVIDNFEDFKSSGRDSTNEFLSLISDSALNLLKINTPVDTGELRNSWQELNRDNRSVELGVSDDQDDKLFFVIKGNKNTPANDFITPIDNQINELIKKHMVSTLKKRHKFWQQIPDLPGTSNITGTVGLTKTRFSTKRVFGRSKLYRVRTGLKRMRVRIGRRRSVGKSIIKSVRLG